MQETWYVVRSSKRICRVFHNLEVAEAFAKELMKSKYLPIEIIEENKKVIWEDGQYID